MNKNVKAFLILVVFLFPVISFAQELPSNFYFKRETGQQSGKPIFELIAHPDAMANDALQGNTFEALGAVAQPELNKYGITLINAKKRFEFRASKNKSCTLTIDDEKTEYPKFTLGVAQTLGKLKIENVAVQIDKNVFEKLVNGDDITIRCGVVMYNLDQDNIDALRYLASEIEKDLERRNKN